MSQSLSQNNENEKKGKIGFPYTSLAKYNWIAKFRDKDDEEACETIYKVYRPFFSYYIDKKYAFLNKFAQEDLIEDSFVTLWEKREQYHRQNNKGDRKYFAYFIKDRISETFAEKYPKKKKDAPKYLTADGLIDEASYENWDDNITEEEENEIIESYNEKIIDWNAFLRAISMTIKQSKGEYEAVKLLVNNVFDSVNINHSEKIDVIQLNILASLSHKEVAEILNISIETSRTRKKRYFELLREKLREVIHDFAKTLKKSEEYNRFIDLINKHFKELKEMPYFNGISWPEHLE